MLSDVVMVLIWKVSVIKKEKHIHFAELYLYFFKAKGHTICQERDWYLWDKKEVYVADFL